MQIKSKERVAKFGEVFTNLKEIKAMWKLIPVETRDNIHSTILEPSCGTGNFMVYILAYKLSTIKDDHVKNALYALKSLHGIDIQQDNVEECKHRLKEVLNRYFTSKNIVIGDKVKDCIDKILDNNIIHGNYLTKDNLQTNQKIKWL